MTTPLTPEQISDLRHVIADCPWDLEAWTRQIVAVLDQVEAQERELDALRTAAQAHLEALKAWAETEENCDAFLCDVLVFDNCGECPGCLVRKHFQALAKALGGVA